MDKAAIGARLKEARNHCNLTQEQLAQKVHKTVTYISDIERGAKTPSLNLFIQMVDVLNISPDYILCGELEAGKQYICYEITKKLNQITAQQRLAVEKLIDIYINFQ